MSIARTGALGAGVSLICALARAASAEPTEEEADEVIVVEGEAPAEAASSVHFDQDDLRARPHATPSDLLRQTPGLVVAQHAGGGKSDQYFLRGFDADHGTDVALFVDGVPVNLTSHAHGQGYADAHWIIPETIASLDVHKGPYAARFGDFYTAGAIDMRTIEPAPGAELWLTGGGELGGPVAGERVSERLVGIAAPRVERGAALIAAEVGSTDGPFLSPQEYRRASALAKGRRRFGGGEAHVAATFYAARWNQSGQVPAAEVAAGRVDRFGSLDPTEGGRSSRWSVSAGYTRGEPLDGAWTADAYLVGYQLQLFSNFTLFARDELHGDQIEQRDDRVMGGADATYRRVHRNGLVRAGVQLRADAAEAGLWHAERRARLDDCWEVANPCNHVDQRVLDAAVYVEEDLSVGSRLRLLGGLRVDQFAWDVTDLDPETRGTAMTTGGRATAAIVSPKLTAIVRASDELDLFVNAGSGFHSNDARAAVASDGDGALARALGAETGARLDVGGLHAAFAVWYLRLSSEQVWSGDLGGTEASDPTRRYGVDAEWAWRPAPWISLDANVAIGRSTFVANHGNGGALALAPRLMAGGGVTLRRGDDLAALRVRGIDRRPANDDGSLQAEGYALVDLVAQRRFGRVLASLTIDNLLDADWREAQFAEESRVMPGAPLVEDVHFTPGAPRTLLLGLGMQL